VRTRTRAFAPHIFSRSGFASQNWQLNLALLLPFLAGLLRFEMEVLLLLFLAVAGAMVAELLFSLLFSQDFALDDGWAVSIGLSSALFIPATAPWWLALLVPALAVLLGKTLPGGISRSLVHPVVLSLLVTFFLFPGTLAYSWPGVAEGAPLENVRLLPWYQQLLSSTGSGALGSTSIVALFVSALLLLLTRSIRAAAILPFLLASLLGLFSTRVPISSQLFAGDTILFALFILPDTSTGPMRDRSRVLYGLLAGLFSVPLRLFLGPMVGLLFAFPLANAFMPLIDYLFLPEARPFLRQNPQFSLPLLLESWRTWRHERTTQRLSAPVPSQVSSSVPAEMIAAVTENPSPPGVEDKHKPARPKRPKETALPLFSQVEVSEREALGPVDACPCGGTHSDVQRDFLEALRKTGWRFFQAVREDRCVGCLQLAPLSSPLVPLKGGDLYYLAFLGTSEEERSASSLLLAQALVVSREKEGLAALCSPRLGESFLAGYGFEVVAEGPNKLMVKRFQPGPEVTFQPTPAGRVQGKALEAYLTPRCPLLAENYRAALDLAHEVDPELETREYSLTTIEEISATNGEGIYLDGLPLSYTFVDLEQWKEILQNLRPKVPSAAPAIGEAAPTTSTEPSPQLSPPGDREQETGDRIEETGDRIEETGDRIEETGDRREETG
jgi:electron transport complex protein RnfD